MIEPNLTVILFTAVRFRLRRYTRQLFGATMRTARLWVTQLRNGNVENVRWALEHGADPNKVEGPYADGETPLHIAAAHGHRQIVQALLGAGADCSIPNRFGSTPLFGASYSGYSDIVELLLNAGAAVEARFSGLTALSAACSNNHLETVRLLLQAGANPFGSEAGAYALHRAAARGALESVQCLLDFGTDMEITDDKGLTPLHKAVINHQLSVVEELLQRGANMLVRRQDGQRITFDFTHQKPTAEQAAIREALLKHYAIRITQQNGPDSIHALFQQASFFKAGGCDVDIPLGRLRKDQFIGLLLSIVSRIPESVRVKDSKTGATPLHLLCGSRPTREAVDYVFKSYPEAGLLQTARGDFPLFLACESGAVLDVIFLLLRFQPEIVPSNG